MKQMKKIINFHIYDIFILFIYGNLLRPNRSIVRIYQHQKGHKSH